MPCCGAEPAGAPAILTQRAARGESGRLWRRSSRACRRRLMSGKLSLPSGKVFSQEAERRGLARLAAGATNLSVPKLKKNDTNKDYDTWGKLKKSIILRCGGAEGLLASQNGVFRGAALGSERVRAALGSDGEFALR